MLLRRRKKRKKQSLRNGRENGSGESSVASAEMTGRFLRKYGHEFVEGAGCYHNGLLAILRVVEAGGECPDLWGVMFDRSEEVQARGMCHAYLVHGEKVYNFGVTASACNGTDYPNMSLEELEKQGLVHTLVTLNFAWEEYRGNVLAWAEGDNYREFVALSAYLLHKCH